MYRIFLEKIVEHPDYPKEMTEAKCQINAKLKEVLAKTEMLKSKLMLKYQEEYCQWQEEQVVFEMLLCQIK